MKMKLDDLQAELKKRALSTSGSKALLQEQMLDVVRRSAPIVVSDRETPGKSGTFNQDLC